MRLMGKPGSLSPDKVHKIANPYRRLSGASPQDPRRPSPKTSRAPLTQNFPLVGAPRTAGFAEPYFTPQVPYPRTNLNS